MTLYLLSTAGYPTHQWQPSGPEGLDLHGRARHLADSLRYRGYAVRRVGATDALTHGRRRHWFSVDTDAPIHDLVDIGTRFGPPAIAEPIDTCDWTACEVLLDLHPAVIDLREAV